MVIPLRQARVRERDGISHEWQEKPLQSSWQSLAEFMVVWKTENRRIPLCEKWLCCGLGLPDNFSGNKRE